MTNPRAHLSFVVAAVVDYLTAIYDIDAMKTVAYYQRALNRAVLQFYRGEIEVGEFIDIQIRLIEEQFRRAWNEGMRANGLDPETDMTDGFEATLQIQINSEFDNVLRFAEDIQTARITEAPIGPLQDRVTLWANRYNEIVNLSMITTKPKNLFEWQLGATEQHCSTCSALNGVIATAEEWQASGYKPQNAPNPQLECGGWRCDCRFVPSRGPKTPEGIPRLL